MKAEPILEMEEAMRQRKKEEAAELAKQSILSESDYNELADQQENSTDLIDELAATAQDKAEFKEAQKQVKDIVRKLKRQFKGLTKTQLIHIIVEQISLAEQNKQLAIKLLEDNKKLIAQLEGTNYDETTETSPKGNTTSLPNIDPTPSGS